MNETKNIASNAPNDTSELYEIEKARLRNLVIDSLVGKKIDDNEFSFRVKDIVFEELKDSSLTYSEKSSLIKEIFYMTRGLGILQPLLEDKNITEIMVNGTENIFIERSGALIQTDVAFASQTELERIVRRIVESVNREINQSNPIVDARLEDGSRINAVFPPVALNGPILTIRKFPEKPLSMEQLIQWKSINIEVAEFLKIMVESKYNIFISGGTGSGKTTFLNMLSNFIPKDERVITIEDSAELQIQGVKNLPRLEARLGSKDSSTNISIRDLIKSSLRMRPDRVVVGEVRGEECLDMLQAMNTGHDGSLSTGHANSARDMMSRLETMVLMAVELPLVAIRGQIASALELVVHLGRLRDKSRKVLEVSEVLGLDDRGAVELNKIYEFVETGVDDNGKIIGELVRTKNKMINVDKLAAAGVKKRF